MNIHEAYRQIGAIESLKNDYERAHGLEDDLYHRFVHYVAELKMSGLSNIAAVVLESENIKFPRYTA